MQFRKQHLFRIPYTSVVFTVTYIIFNHNSFILRADNSVQRFRFVSTTWKSRETILYRVTLTNKRQLLTY